MLRRVTAGAVLVSAFALAAPGLASAADPVLGSPNYVMGGSGWGTVAPKDLFNGGVPSGLLTDITWKGWGSRVAHGRAWAAIYRPQGNYYPRVRIPVKATTLGRCPGSDQRAYLKFLIRVPQWPGGPLGSWKKWSGSKDVCDHDSSDPASRGSCKPVGAYGEVGTVQSVEAYRVSCATARRAARRISARAGRGGQWPLDCAQSGCRVKAAGLRCRLDRLHDGETTLASEAASPVQRLSCRRGKGTVSAFLVVPVEFTYGD